jgi:hypothetical protein
MQKKNVYLFYPPGYHGSYITWALSISDYHSAGTTVKNPVNTTNSISHGGVGTSHLHVRAPTHQGLDENFIWQHYNQLGIDDRRCYVCNMSDEPSNIKDFISVWSRDPTAVCIVLHANNDPILESYLNINCVTKWPTFLAATLNLKYGSQVRLSDQDRDDIKSIDFFNCTHSLLLRNLIVRHANLLGLKTPVALDQLQDRLDHRTAWVNLRHECQPHEVDTSTYADSHSVDLKHSFIQLSALDVVSSNFPDILQQLLDTTGISDNFNLDQLRKIHPEYMAAQPNLQWFTSFAHWELTGQLDTFLTGHMAVQAQLIKHIFKNSGMGTLDTNWVNSYRAVRAAHWPEVIDSYDFHGLEEYMKENLMVRGVQPPAGKPPEPNMLQMYRDHSWQAMSLDEINLVYQTNKTIDT